MWGFTLDKKKDIYLWNKNIQYLTEKNSIKFIQIFGVKSEVVGSANFPTAEQRNAGNTNSEFENANIQH